MHIYTNIYIYIHLYIYVYTHKYIYMYTHICIYMHIHVCVYLRFHIYIDILTCMQAAKIAVGIGTDRLFLFMHLRTIVLLNWSLISCTVNFDSDVELLDESPSFFVAPCALQQLFTLFDEIFCTEHVQSVGLNVVACCDT